MPLIRSGRFAEDDFVLVPDEDDIPADINPIVSVARFQTERESLLARGGKLGVKLKSSDSPEALREDLSKISVVAIEFPTFRDGRGFSWARLLRTRLGYKGEIRAVGYFLYDQLAFLARTGFDAFEVRQDFREEDFARAMREMSYFYQPSADGRKTIRELRASR